MKSKNKDQTPIPTSDLSSLKESSTRTETLVEALIETVIPPIAKDSREARDGVIGLTTSFIGMEKRVDTIETTPAVCEKEGEITGLGIKTKSLENWRRLVIAIGITVVMALTGAAAKAISDSAETRTVVRQNTEQLKILNTKVIPANQQKIIKAVSAFPEEIARETVVIVRDEQQNGHTPIKKVVEGFSHRTKRLLVRNARPEELKALGLAGTKRDR